MTLKTRLQKLENCDNTGFFALTIDRGDDTAAAKDAYCKERNIPEELKETALWVFVTKFGRTRNDRQNAA